MTGGERTGGATGDERTGGATGAGGETRAPVGEAARLVRGFRPETDLERAVAQDPELLEGLAWGKPRRAHPEGAVGNHVADLLARIDEDGETGERRAQLRFVALVHDAFKSRVREWLPHSGWNHHANRARRFAERYTDDDRLLETIEQHDRPYNLWKKMRRRGRLDERAFQTMLDRIPDHELFMRFVEIDGSSEAKNPEPIAWFREQVERRGLVGER
ncbi:MAG TPA: HD domain-containing protein [Thermoleophilaceae bacterium]